MKPSLYPSLMVVVTSNRAVWWRIDKDRIHELRAIDEPKSVYSDREGYFRSGGGGTVFRSGEPDMVNRRHSADMKAHVRRVGMETVTLWQHEVFGSLCLVTTEKMKPLVHREMVRQLPDCPLYPHVGNHIHADAAAIRDIFTACVRSIPNS